jgi:hypothetical protein
MPPYPTSCRFIRHSQHTSQVRTISSEAMNHVHSYVADAKT